jgi:hypothetical protein
MALTESGRCKNMRFKKRGMQKTTPNSRPQKGDMSPVPYWRPQNLKWPLDLTCTSLSLRSVHVGHTVSSRRRRRRTEFRRSDYRRQRFVPLTKTACTTVPGVGEDVHIYIRCATRIFRRGGACSESIYNLCLVLEIMSQPPRRKYSCTITLFATVFTYIQM